MVEKVIPAIKDKMRWAKSVHIQYDNARPHVAKGVRDKIVKAGRKRGRGGGPVIIIEDQPAQSPDCNANDLGFYASLDSRMPKYRDFNLDKLFGQVLTEYDNYPSDMLSRLFETKSEFLKQVVLAQGHIRTNNYQKPHKKRRK